MRYLAVIIIVLLASSTAFFALRQPSTSPAVATAASYTPAPSPQTQTISQQPVYHAKQSPDYSASVTQEEPVESPITVSTQYTPVSDVINYAPPPLPIYVVPAPPAPQYVWTPGHWRWASTSYYWVPGVWVRPPVTGVLWTPGYWGWHGGGFGWHEGYWAPHVGFYGGIHYGGGYNGSGFSGGSWRNNNYVVNRSVTNVTNVTNITNVTHITNITNNYNSFNGGPGGTNAVPTSQERAIDNEKHIAPTHEQIAHMQAASRESDLRAAVNNGKPAVAAMHKPGAFSGKDVVAASQAGLKNPVTEKYNNDVVAKTNAGHQQAPKKPEPLQETAIEKAKPAANNTHALPVQAQPKEAPPLQNKPKPVEPITQQKQQQSEKNVSHPASPEKATPSSNNVKQVISKPSVKEKITEPNVKEKPVNKPEANNAADIVKAQKTKEEKEQHTEHKTESAEEKSKE